MRISLKFIEQFYSRRNCFIQKPLKALQQHRKLGDRNKLSLGTFVFPPLGFTSSYYFFKDRNTYILLLLEYTQFEKDYRVLHISVYVRLRRDLRQKQKATLKVIVGDILS